MTVRRRIRFYDVKQQCFLPENSPIVMDGYNRLFFLVTGQGDGALRLEGPISDTAIKICIDGAAYNLASIDLVDEEQP